MVTHAKASRYLRLLRTGDSVFLGWDFNPVSAAQNVQITLRRVLDGSTYHLGRYRIGDGAAVAVLPKIPAGEIVFILENLTTRKTREFDGMYAHGIRLRGFENVNVLYRGYGHSFTCEQDWPPELNPKPTLQLSYSTDGGMNWVFWRRDLQANFIDLPPSEQCLLRYYAPEITPADTVGPFRVVDQTEQYIRFHVGQELRFENREVAYIGQNNYDYDMGTVHYRITSQTEEVDRIVYSAQWWRSLSGKNIDSSAASIVQMRGGFQDITGSHAPFNMGAVHGRYSTVSSDVIMYRVEKPRYLLVVFTRSTGRLFIQATVGYRRTGQWAQW